MKRVLAAIIAILAVAGLAMQFEFALTNPATQEIPAAERIIRYFSFFTVVSNLIVAIVTISIAVFPRSRLDRYVNTASVLTAASVYITIVAVVYSLFLRSVFSTLGWHDISNHI